MKLADTVTFALAVFETSVSKALYLRLALSSISRYSIALMVVSSKQG